jgi:hypothetical protein
VKFFQKKINNKTIKEFFGKKETTVNSNKNSNNIEASDESEQLESHATKKINIVKIIEKYSLIVYVMSAFIINFMIETISRHSFVAAYNFFFERGHVFLYNSFIIFVTLTLSYLVRKRVFAFMVIGGVWLIGGITNGVILSFRTTPFTGTDLKLISSAASVSTKYMSIDQIILAFLLVVVAIGFFVFLGIKAPKYKGKMRYRRNIVFIILMFASIVPVTKYSIDARILSTYFGNIVIAYEDYGFPYCFWCTVIAKGMDCPNDYDEREVKNIVRMDGKDSYDSEKTPNIIIVQLESFIDPKLIKGLEYSEDPIPNFRKLKKNFTSGYITVPVVGAGTVNTEFEILTGMSLRYFGPGEYPYKTVMSDNVCESVAYDLKNIGYSTHAIHNNVASFYGRTGVFAKLGFDSFTSSEMMNITNYTPIGWAKDAVLTNSIMDSLNSSEGQDFVYTITVQSHGGYPTEQILENQKISVSGTNDDAKSNSIEYYVNQINEVDQFIGDLVEELSNYDEDTVLILFGDHQPSLGQKAKELSNGSLFKTEYVIWDNMGLKKKDKNIKAYQMSALALDKVGMHIGTLMKFHQKRMGTKYYYSDLDVLQYDMLYGEKYVYGGESPYEELDLQMGVKDITISSIEVGTQDSVIVKGENFNTSSKVKVNDKDVDFEYVNVNTLTLPEYSICNGDVFEVDQVSSTGEILRKGITFTYEIELPELPPLTFSFLDSNIITDHRRKH